MATIHILFIGVVDANLVNRIKALGFDVEATGAQHKEIWSLSDLQKKGTGYRMSRPLLKLISQARDPKWNFVIVNTSLEFMPSVLNRLPSAIERWLILDGKRPPTDDERDAISKFAPRECKIGVPTYSTFALIRDALQPPTRPSARRRVEPQRLPRSDAPYCYQCAVQMQRAGSLFACPACGGTNGGG